MEPIAATDTGLSTKACQISGRPASHPAVELSAGPPELALPCAHRTSASAVPPFMQEKPVRRAGECIAAQGARSPREQDAYLVGVECSLPLPHPGVRQQVPTVIWLDPEDQVLVGAEDAYDSDEDISDSSSLAGARNDGFGTHGSGSGSDLRMDTCGSVPEAPLPLGPEAPQPFPIGPDTVQQNALRAATPIAVMSSTISTSPCPGSNSICEVGRTGPCATVPDPIPQVSDHACAGSGSSVAADGGGGGGSSISACVISHGTQIEHPGADGRNGPSRVGGRKQYESNKNQQPAKRRCMESGKASPPSAAQLVAADQEKGQGVTRCRYTCRKVPVSVRETLQMPPSGSPDAHSSGLKRPVGQDHGAGSQDSHSGFTVITTAIEVGMKMGSSQVQNDVRLMQELGRDAPFQQLHPPDGPSDYHNLSPKPPTTPMEPIIQHMRQPFSRSSSDASQRNTSSTFIASCRVAEAVDWTSHQCLPPPKMHAARPMDAQAVQSNIGNRSGGSGGSPTAAPHHRAPQMPSVYFCSSCRAHASCCGRPVTSRATGDCSPALAGSAAATGSLAMLSTATLATGSTSWAANQCLAASAVRADALAAGPRPCSHSAALPYGRSTSLPSLPTGAIEPWPVALPETQQTSSLICRCRHCMTAVSSLPSNQRHSYTPYQAHGRQSSPSSIDSDRISLAATESGRPAEPIAAVTHAPLCPPLIAASQHAQGQSTGPLGQGQLTNYITVRSCHVAPPPPHLLHHSFMSAGSLCSCPGSHSCLSCAPRWPDTLHGRPGPGRGLQGLGHMHRQQLLRQLPCGMKRQVSLPEMPVGVGISGSGGTCMVSQQPLKGGIWSPRSRAGAAMAHMEVSGAASTGGIIPSFPRLPCTGPRNRSEPTVQRGAPAEIPREVQQQQHYHQQQYQHALPGAAPAHYRQHTQRHDQMSSGSSSYVGTPSACVPAPAAEETPASVATIRGQCMAPQASQHVRSPTAPAPVPFGAATVGGAAPPGLQNSKPLPHQQHHQDPYQPMGSLRQQPPPLSLQVRQQQAGDSGRVQAGVERQSSPGSGVGQRLSDSGPSSNRVLATPRQHGNGAHASSVVVRPTNAASFAALPLPLPLPAQFPRGDKTSQPRPSFAIAYSPPSRHDSACQPTQTLSRPPCASQHRLERAPNLFDYRVVEASSNIAIGSVHTQQQQPPAATGSAVVDPAGTQPGRYLTAVAAFVQRNMSQRSEEADITEIEATKGSDRQAGIETAVVGEEAATVGPMLQGKPSTAATIATKVTATRTTSAVTGLTPAASVPFPGSGDGSNYVQSSHPAPRVAAVPPATPLLGLQTSSVAGRPVNMNSNLTAAQDICCTCAQCCSTSRGPTLPPGDTWRQQTGPQRLDLAKHCSDLLLANVASGGSQPAQLASAGSGAG